jgi:hypothetical protein
MAALEKRASRSTAAASVAAADATTAARCRKKPRSGEKLFAGGTRSRAAEPHLSNIHGRYPSWTFKIAKLHRQHQTMHIVCWTPSGGFKARDLVEMRR